jgi:hypothetical protein
MGKRRVGERQPDSPGRFPILYKKVLVDVIGPKVHESRGKVRAKRLQVGHDGGGVLEALIDVLDLPVITDCPVVIQCTYLISLGRFNHGRHKSLQILKPTWIDGKLKYPIYILGHSSCSNLLLEESHPERAAARDRLDLPGIGKTERLING